MRVILCRRQGRTFSRRGGGYFNAGRHYAQLAGTIPGMELASGSVRNPKGVQRLERPDLLWVFGSESDSAAFVDIAANWEVPVLLDSGYNSSRARNLIIVRKMQEVDPTGSRGVFFNTFTTTALFDPLLESIRDRLVALPHPFKRTPSTTPFSGREGICIGDVGKMTSPQRTGIDPFPVIEKLLEKGYPVIGLHQYPPVRKIPEGIVVKPYKHALFQESLAQFRVYVAFTQHETFGMVPMEALAAGTPVVYPPMPQSLSEYIGPAGLCYRDEDDLVELVELLYRNEFVWNGMSASGVRATEAHNHLSGPRLLAAFQWVLRAFNARNRCDTPTG